MPVETTIFPSHARQRRITRQPRTQACPGCRSQMQRAGTGVYICDPCGRFWDLDAAGKPRSF